MAILKPIDENLIKMEIILSIIEDLCYTKHF